MAFFRDTATIFSREFAPVWRDPLSLAFSMAQPLLFLYLFGPLLAEGTATPGPAWQWFVPGILIMMCLSGPLMSGYFLLIDLIGGSMERLLVTPVSRTALLIGRTLKEFVVLLAQAVLIIGLAIPLGLELHAPGVLTGLTLLVVFGIGLGALSFVLAMISAPGGELFYGITQIVMFPLLLLSGVLLPIENGPGWLQTAASINPVTYIVEAERALFTGGFMETPVLYGALAALVTAALGLYLGRRRMAQGL
ncbi:ABC transporter permease [Herbidospora mongoliensis]|uniref:ABC transporter permease n=1 Tax=Herbidospora mongoliensis TaxID=688067 RepID=UPI00083294AC|nr:ABC transporter permease [Herbidospora mongoliensis]